jgi:hypothetical protein
MNVIELKPNTTLHIMHTGLKIKQKYIKNVNKSTCLNLHKQFKGIIKNP